MARKAATAKRSIDEKELTKGQIRKLNALRKSLRDSIAEKAFAEWLKTQTNEAPDAEDEVAMTIVEVVEKALAQKKMRMPRGGYLVRRGLGRIIVEPAA